MPSKLRGYTELAKLAGLAISGSFLGTVLLSVPQTQGGKTKAPAKPAAAAPKPTFERDVLPMVNKYCVSCHGPDDPIAGVSLSNFKTAKSVEESRVIWDRVAKNVASSHMPPKGLPAPTAAQRKRMVEAINHILVGDRAAASPGRVTMRRLNRAEYNNTIRDLVGVDFKPAEDFPSDDVGYGFDNIGDVLSLSPLLVEKYMTAAEQVVDRAVYTPRKPIVIAGEALQVEGGVRPMGGAAVMFSNGTAIANFRVPVAGMYRLRISANGDFAGGAWPRLEVLAPGGVRQGFNVEQGPAGRKSFEIPLRLEGGANAVRASFTNDFYDEKAPANQRDRNLRIFEMALVPPAPGELPASHRLAIGDAPEPGRERETARAAITRFAARAFRRPVKAEEVDRLLKIYDLADKANEPYESRMKYAIQAVLVSPHFLFRIETDPPNRTGVRNLNDWELATRLSYFIWSSMPDQRLFDLAAQGKLKDPNVMAVEAKRMLADPKAEALADNFAEQWLQLRKLEIFEPNPKQFPSWNEKLKESAREETKRFFMAMIRENRPVTDFIDGKFTYINEPLAKHYGIPNVTGEEFRKVSLEGTQRGGVLTQASVLAITSNPTRTSPVKRGKWVLENILGTPPPPPPPGVGDLGDDETLLLTTANLRERMEQHRKKPDCFSCHSRMDPIGFGMENYDAVGRWRTVDDGSAIDNSGVLPDGRKFKGPNQLKQILMQNQDQFVETLADRLLTYALGRGIDARDKIFVEEVADRAAANDNRFVSMIVGVVQSDPFRKRTNQ